MRLVAGVDSSTQSCKVVIREAESGTLVRQGSASHPPGTEVDPEAWWRALHAAFAEAGGLDDVEALAIGGQQHGMVCLDESGQVVRPALLWNDTRSAHAAGDLVRELGAEAWAQAVGSVPVAAFTATKLRWLAEHEPENAARVAAVCLPHDWLTWRLRGSTDISELTTDRSDASGTGYWSPGTGQYRRDLLRLAFGRDLAVPRVADVREVVGRFGRLALAPGAGDNAAAALGLGARVGDVVVSIGTSGTVFAVCDTPTAEATGTVAGFADATGRFLPLVCTLNAARVLDAGAAMARTDLDGLSELALSAPPGADGLTLIPYLEGERTPNLPDAAGSIHGLRLANATAAHLARAAVEGMLCGLADGLDALTGRGVPVQRIVLIGGGARSEAVRTIAPAILGHSVTVPPPGEYVADGAAVQAGWALSGTDEPPRHVTQGTETYDAKPLPELRERYHEFRDRVA
ncbi:xylulokinase [Catenulispora pinisilvae]|uniref:xylulokinase n=1 Tax=Catenulispora pinisilvae TaxID=2705253 RepID=UPI001890EDF5|nr:xylulokinase [Catenulispora pinisilvae]